MKKLFIATGNFYRFVDKISPVEFINSFQVEGIEYTYGKSYGERPITKKDISIMRKKEVSLHLPFKYMIFKENKEKDVKDFYKILEDYELVKAKRIVFHPHQKIEKKLLKKAQNKGVNFVTENMRKKHWKSKRTMHKRKSFEDILNSDKKIDLCLDVAHAYTWSPKETSNIIETWEDRIKQVHLSSTKNLKDHLTLQKITKSFSKSIKPIKNLEVPVILEEDMPKIDKKFVEKEIKLAKKIIGLN